MAILRIDIIRALDELIANEAGLAFQALAVVLTKQKWPDLIASEWHNDGGLDAFAPASLAHGKKAKGVASSITGKGFGFTGFARMCNTLQSSVSGFWVCLAKLRDFGNR